MNLPSELYLAHTKGMSYNIGTHISFKKKEAHTLFRASTEYAVGTRVRFLDWLAGAATLDLSAA